MKSIAALLLLVPGTVLAQARPETYPPDTVLVVAPTNYPFAGIQISGGIPGAVVVESSLVQAFRIAKAEPNVTGVIDINLATDQAWETGRVVCYASSGEKRWEEKVFFNVGGGAERVAEKFTDKLAAKTRGKTCK
ncbi:hypothetical protein ACFPOA_02730 [Lysobacter niabensis]|uniref:hypothetical protein n=1 Tax=Agrilutibacter niabensis TaxID=380628 RepID=UPI003614258A